MARRASDAATVAARLSLAALSLTNGCSPRPPIEPHPARPTAGDEVAAPQATPVEAAASGASVEHATAPSTVALPTPTGALAVAPPDAPPANAEPPRAFSCAPPDRGWGRYEPFVRLPFGKLSVPIVDAPPADGAYDLYLHFHASDAARRGFVDAGYPMLFVGIDVGEGSKAYGRAFDDPGAFPRLVASIERGLRDRTGDPRVHVRHTVLSSWSAGFAASTRILKQHPGRVRAVVLLDSLYAPYAVGANGEVRQGEVFEPPLRGVLALGKQALAAERALFLTYSRAPTSGYASTEEVAATLLARWGLRADTVDPEGDPRGLVAKLDREGLHLRGHRGADAKAHCRHLAYVGEAVRAVRDLVR